MSEESNVKPVWSPLECNPEAFTKFTRLLGCPDGEWVDVFSLDDDFLSFLPQPVSAIIMLFPINERYDKTWREQDAQTKAARDKGQGLDLDKDIFHMRQLVGNACGTVALLHALGNVSDRLTLEEGSILREFIQSTKDSTSYERGVALQTFPRMEAVHEEAALAGTTAIPERGARLDNHFVCFVHKNGELLELDGRRDFPIKRGPSSEETFLEDAAKACGERMKIFPDVDRFIVIALCTP